MRNVLKTQNEEQRWTERILRTLTLPSSTPPIRLPEDFRKSAVASSKFNWPGPDNKGAQAVWTGTPWHPASGAGSMCFSVVFFGQPMRPALVLVDGQRFVPCTYWLNFYDPSTTTGGSVLDAGRPGWSVLAGVQWALPSAGNWVYPHTVEIGQPWSVACLTAGVPGALHGANPPVGYHSKTDRDVLFLQTGDVLTLVVTFPGSVLPMAAGSGAVVPATGSFQFTMFRLDDRGSTRVGTLTFSAPLVTTVAGAQDLTQQSWTIPASYSATGMGHYYLVFDKVTAETSGSNGYVPTGEILIKIGWRPATTVGPKWAMVANPMLDPALRGDIELARTCRTTAAALLVSPGAMNATGVGTLECFRTEWNETIRYEELRNNPTCLPAISGAYTYMPPRGALTRWSECAWGPSGVYEICDCYAHVINLVGNSTNAAVGYGITIDLNIETEAGLSRLTGLVTNVPDEAWQQALRLLESRREWFMENPEHLGRVWNFLRDAAQAVWRGVRVMTPYIAPVVATVNPEAAIIMDAFSRLINASGASP